MNARTLTLPIALSLLTARGVAFAQTQDAPAEAPSRPRLAHAPPGVSARNAPLTLSFTPVHPELIERVVVSWRTAPSAPWQELTAARDEQAWSVTIPAQPVDVHALSYFVTTVTRRGESIASFASREAPHVVVLRPDDEDENELRDLATYQRNHLEFLVGGEYTNLGARPNVGNAVCGRNAGESCEDWWYLLYGQVRYRFHRRVRSVAVRVERLAGVTTRQESIGAVTRDVGLVSASAEVEFRLWSWCSTALIAILGANELSVQGGGGVRLELGTGLPARVQLSFQGITQYGVVGAAWMRWDTVPDTPLGAGVEITTQPGANVDPGVRLLFEVGRRFGRHVTVSLRGGYGARRESAAGFSGGGSVQLAF